jgi:hypothetical protein
VRIDAVARWVDAIQRAREVITVNLGEGTCTGPWAPRGHPSMDLQRGGGGGGAPQERPGLNREAVALGLPKKGPR